MVSKYERRNFPNHPFLMNTEYLDMSAIPMRVLVAGSLSNILSTIHKDDGLCSPLRVFREFGSGRTSS